MSEYKFCILNLGLYSKQIWDIRDGVDGIYLERPDARGTNWWRLWRRKWWYLVGNLPPPLLRDPVEVKLANNDRTGNFSDINQNEDLETKPINDQIYSKTQCWNILAHMTVRNLLEENSYVLNSKSGVLIIWISKPWVVLIYDLTRYEKLFGKSQPPLITTLEELKLARGFHSYKLFFDNFFTGIFLIKYFLDGGTASIKRKSHF